MLYTFVKDPALFWLGDLIASVAASFGWLVKLFLKVLLLINSLLDNPSLLQDLI